MNKFLTILALTLFNACLSQNDTLLKYFRVTNLSKGKIALQANIETVKDIVEKDDAEHYHLKKESYDIADSIGLEVNKSNQIISITFRYDYSPEYSNDTAYIHELHKFQKIIGSKGKEFKTSYKGKSVIVNKWEDKKTIFELVEVTKNGKKQKVYSTLFDIQLIETSEIKAERKKKDKAITIIKEL
jgi:hypothetical protein